MATITRNPAQPAKIIILEPEQPESYTLTLSKEELQALMTVLRLVSGHPKTSARSYTDSIYDPMTEMIEDKTYYPATGSIYFKEE